MHVLSFESSCDETAVAVLHADGHTLTPKADVIASQIDIHRLYGGVVPEIASRAHVEAISRLTYEALDRASLSLSDIDLIAVTSHPGLIGALLVGVNFAKSLAAANGIPLVEVDHIKGHIAAAYVTHEKNEHKEVPKPPFLALVVSGGHTSVFLVEDYTRHTLLASTRDDAMGEAFDKVGRLLSLPYPAGAAFDSLASEGFALYGCDVCTYKNTEAARESEWHLPSPALTGDAAPDLSFSGPKTAAVNLMNRLKQKNETVDHARCAAHFTYVAVEGVARQLSLLLDRYPGLPLVMGGGVAANSHLRRYVARLAEEKKSRLFVLPLALCGDNGTMIAAAGYYAYRNGERADSTLNASAADGI